MKLLSKVIFMRDRRDTQSLCSRAVFHMIKKDYIIIGYLKLRRRKSKQIRQFRS